MCNGSVMTFENKFGLCQFVELIYNYQLYAGILCLNFVLNPVNWRILVGFLFFMLITEEKQG